MIARILDIVRANPGRTAPEYGHAISLRYRAENLSAWQAENPGKTPPEWLTRESEPGDYSVALNSKPLTSLHRKGLVRREKAGQTYRYWPTEPA